MLELELKQGFRTSSLVLFKLVGKNNNNNNTWTIEKSDLPLVWGNPPFHLFSDFIGSFV